MTFLVRDLVEVVDETSRLYHRVGVVVDFTRAGRPVVQFRRRLRTWRRPWGSLQHVMNPDQVGLV